MLTRLIEQSLTPKLAVATNSRFFISFRGAFFTLMPLTIIGSVFMLITDFPVPGYAQFMTGLFGTNWSTFISPAYRATFNMMGILLAGTMAYKLAESYELDKLTVGILGIVSYVVVTPKSLVMESGEKVADIMQFDWLGTKGIITAILCATIAVQIFRFCVSKNATIRLPESVPPMVISAFAALIPGVITVTLLLIINGISMILAGSFPELIFTLIQAPLQTVIGQPWAIVLVAFLNGLLWWAGIHPTVVNSLIYPFLYANAASNQLLADAGNLTATTGMFGSVQMLDQFLTIGGAGMMIGMTISMLIAARSMRMKVVSKVAFIPSLFNISEPVTFATPTVFEPLMLMPMILTPVLACLVVMGAQSIGIMPMFTNVQAPWATPFLFSGFLVAGWNGALLQMVIVVITVLVYLPFTKALDLRFANEESELESN
ncbi:PTS system, lactose/cellobiose family IIC subunit [Coriobacterium glomerans PW2]|uniref:Permease IIC component n=1 Tax=Coriobacterium glomerans (strain ATCC 49209 / DSM 20642 / JCM 10262 / PW2) TaxID=700015 RepID=F2N9X6_CORGP|nr:PTS transporter subunit EIIC [Coriobacterium glomerans]AEB06231.1 PTS system, lactose/cellobiose family IIC subunit [Coriobacterium glomerans PW2]